ncbi:MAG: sigma-70 family RNA polymerase sigma factor [Thermodesulfobacteriota bacterium]
METSSFQAMATNEREGFSDSAENTVGPYDPLRRYLYEISKHHLLSRHEEQELAIRAREQNDHEAAKTLVTSNLRLVVKMAMRYYRYWTKGLLDLIQEGNMGLLQAAKNFNPHRGIKFSYYASFWIRAYILRFIMENWRLIKIGTTQSQRKLFYRLAKERDRLISQGFFPEPRLIAERLDVKEEEVVEMSKRMGSWEVSLDSPANEGSRESRQAHIPDSGKGIDDEISERERKFILREQFDNFYKSLSEQEAEIFDKRIMADEPMTLQELGDRYRVSRERIRQIQEKIKERSKHWLMKNIPNFEQEYSDLV